MNPYAIIAALVIAIGIGAGGYFKGRHDEAAVTIERERDGLLAYAAKIKTGVEQNDQDKIVIANLRAERDRLRNTIHFPVCAKDSDEAGRVFSASVDRLFGEFQERVGRLIEEADNLNADAIRANSLTP